MPLDDSLFSLICLGISGDRCFAAQHKDYDWSLLYKKAGAHAVTGLVFAAIEKLPIESRPPKDVLMKWIAVAEHIKRTNAAIDRKCKDVTELLDRVGLDSCILKGQGNCQYYNLLGVDLGALRQPGDIDVWVKPHDNSFEKNINGSVSWIRKQLLSVKEGKVGKTVYHHIEWSLPGTSVEVHYRPQQLNSPFANIRFQKWCNDAWKKIGESGNGLNSKGFKSPSLQFNLVYQMAHMYHHLLFEGLILKQVTDYFVLLNANDGSAIKNNEVEDLFRSFGMLRFAKGMMWVMEYVYHLPSEKMIVSPCAKEGQFILNEIIRSSAAMPTKESVAAKFWRRTKYRARFLTHYPSEILWDIPFRLYHWFWRMLYAG